MPISLVDNDKLHLGKTSKISKLPEYSEVLAAMRAGIPEGKSIHLTFSPETIKIFPSKQKAAIAFMQKLTREIKKSFDDKFIVRAPNGEIWISHRETK